MKTNGNQSEIDYVSLLELSDFSPETQETGAREYRIRGIDWILGELKKQLNQEEIGALNRYLRMCPSIKDLTEHLQHYPESKPMFETYIQKLHQQLPSLVSK